MKKILFIVFAVSGLSTLASAQHAKASPIMEPLPTAVESAKAAQTKSTASGMATAPVAAPKVTKSAAANTAKYKKAGLTDTQITSINQSMADLDKKKADIANDNKLTPQQKKDGMSAIEAERNAVLMKSMGEDKYKVYTIQQAEQQGKAKPGKAIKN